MEIYASALISVRTSKRGTSALVRITAQGTLLWRWYRVPLPMTAEDMHTVAQAAAGHLVPNSGRVRLSFQLPLLVDRTVEKKDQ